MCVSPRERWAHVETIPARILIEKFVSVRVSGGHTSRQKPKHRRRCRKGVSPRERWAHVETQVRSRSTKSARVSPRERWAHVETALVDLWESYESVSPRERWAHVETGWRRAPGASATRRSVSPRERWAHVETPRSAAACQAMLFGGMIHRQVARIESRSSRRSWKMPRKSLLRNSRPALPPTGQESRGGPLYDQVASVQMLAKAFDRVRFNNGAAGGDGISVQHFASSADLRLRRLAHELRTGRYLPGPLRRVYIPKSSGGLRPLDIPCVVDRVVQAAAALVLDPILDREMEPSSFAYRRGRSVAHAVARVASLRREGYRHVVDGDIVRFFERIPHERLIVRLEKYIDDPALIDLVWLWLESAMPSGLGVPQGSPISPLLANVYLDQIDEEIEGRGIRLVRFADDFLLLCKSEGLAETALGKMKTMLARHGLELHASKTRLVDFDQGFRFLGHMFVRSMIVKEVDMDETPSEDAIAAAEAATDAFRKFAEPVFADADAASGGRAPRLRPLYVIEPGRRLEAAGETLKVTENGVDKLALPPGRIGRIELGPDTDATLAALDLAQAWDIEVVRVNGFGQPVARYEAPDHDRSQRHLAQAACHLDEPKRVDLARRIVAGRIFNQRVLLRRLNRERKDGQIALACQQLGRVLRKLPSAGSVKACMGHEGDAGRIYWPAIGLCAPETFVFSRRERTRTASPVNRVLSMMAGLLSRDVRSMALRAGLHVGFGALHSVDDLEDACVFDLVEEFRAPVAEAATMALFNRRALRPEHFQNGEDGSGLARDAWRIILRGYEAWIARPVVSPQSGNRVLWRGLMFEQAHAYGRHCEGREPYRPYAMDH